MPNKEKDNQEGAVAGGNTPQQPEVVQISKADLDSMMEVVASVNEMKEAMKAQSKTIEILTAASDKRRVEEIEEKLKAPGNSLVKLRTLRNNAGERKVVVEWVMLENDTYIDPLTKREVAKQTIAAQLEDKTTLQFPYNDFDRLSREQMVLAEVVEKAGSKYTVKVLGAEEKQLTLDVKFLN